MKKFKYSIFDLDGTLLDSMWVWDNLGQDYLLKKGVSAPDNLKEILASMSMLEAAKYFQTAFNIKLSPENIVSEIKSFIEDKYKYELKLKPFVKEYLQKLKDEGIKMCIATASPISLAMPALIRNEIIDFFSFVSSCDEVGVGKNKPDIFYMAANKLNADVSEIAVYDDADFALITAKEAGFFTVGVYDDFYKEKRKDIEIISDIFIENFNELM